MPYCRTEQATGDLAHLIGPLPPTSSIASILTTTRRSTDSSPHSSKRKITCRLMCFCRRRPGIMRTVSGRDIVIGWGAWRGGEGGRGYWKEHGEVDIDAKALAA
jgi:hypothetical protein